MTPSLHQQGIPDDDVPKVLARAAALDAEFAAHMPLTRLREIAHEAGVSDAALAEALAEYAGHAAMSRPQAQLTRMLFANSATLLISAALVVSDAMLARIAGLWHRYNFRSQFCPTRSLPNERCFSCLTS